MPQLLLTADPDFDQLALHEFRRDSHNGQPLAELAPGVWLLDCDEGFWGLAEAWIDEPPVFARHICPVDRAVPLIATPKDAARLSDAAVAEYTDLLDPEVSFSVQSRILADLPYKPFDLNRALSAALADATGTPLDVREPFQILSIVCADVPTETVPLLPVAPSAGGSVQGTQFAFLGLSLASHNLSDWAGGVRRFRREKGQISRAEFKLLEALDTFNIDLPAGGVVLDLGAAPGGWTRVLRQKEQYVTAVDPAALHPRLAQDRGVRHKRMTAGEYLREGPDTFDFLVNDMRMNAQESARLMNDFAPFLYSHGEALMTVKLPQSDRARLAVLEETCALLARRYRILRQRQLFHNRSEVTLYLQVLKTGS